MIEYNYLINDVLTKNVNALDSFTMFAFVILALILSLMIDIIFAELPTRIHPVVIVGSMISFFKNVFINFKSRLSGLFVVIGVCVLSAIILFIILHQ